MINAARVLENGHIVLPKKTITKLHLVKGTNLKLISDEEGILVLKTDIPSTQVSKEHLRLQQKALTKIWDSPEEDIYGEL